MNQANKNQNDSTPARFAPPPGGGGATKVIGPNPTISADITVGVYGTTSPSAVYVPSTQTMYLFWTGEGDLASGTSDGIWYSSSTDGGKSWAASTRMSDVSNLGIMLTPTPAEIAAKKVAGAAALLPSTSPSAVAIGDQVCVFWVSANDGIAGNQVYYTATADGGKTWLDPQSATALLDQTGPKLPQSLGGVNAMYSGDTLYLVFRDTKGHISVVAQQEFLIPVDATLNTAPSSTPPSAQG